MGMNRDRKKVFLLGMDGVPLELIQPWLDSGEMPTLKQIQEQSRYGTIVSCIPPSTSAAFASIMTGKNPGKHGIYDFFAKKDVSYDFGINTFSDIKAETVWHILSRHGKKVNILNLPFTYPIKPVNGCIISGLITPHGAKDYCYPEGLLDELSLNVGDYYLHLDEKYEKGNVHKFIDEQNKSNKIMVDYALYMMEKKEWDFFFMHFITTDRVLHEVWHFNDPTHPQYDPKEVRRDGNVLKEFYIRLDREIKRVIDRLEDNTTLIIFSDHGFCGIERFINMNTWLLLNGYITLKNSILTKIKYIFNRYGFNYYSIGKLLLKMKLTKYLMRKDFEGRQAGQQKFFLSLMDVDWRKTLAFSSGFWSQIYINRKNYFKNGIVDENEYPRLLEEIKEKLFTLRDPDTGEKLIDKVYFKKEIYSGAWLDYAPDILFEMKNKRYKPLGLADFPSTAIIEDIFGCTGNHSHTGLIMIKGPEVNNYGYTIHNASIYDIAPTVLKLFNILPDNDMDGKPLI
ncbi:MAG: alkaline phosphatase family protein [Candidatus Hydrogenedentota bacterium]